jgi:phosphatidylglycerophosphatase A
VTFTMFIATLGGAGRLKPGPGTWGSLVVLPLVLLGPVACWVLAAVLAVAGYWAARHVLVDDTEDPGWFVIDEGAGMLIALAALPAATLQGVVLAFALFRLFDIAKPWPISWADAQPAPAGVMADDLIAGGIAAALLFLLHSFWPGVLT